MAQRNSNSPIEQAINYIESNLQDGLTPGKVASEAGFSEYHFHRMFASALGESISEYIKKRRLALAAERLHSSSESIMEIALSCQFDSQEAFTRAFKRAFGVTPGKYRTEGPYGYVFKPRTTDAMIAHLSGGITMKPEIVERAAQTCIGMGGSFEPKAVNDIGALWGRFMKRYEEVPNVNHEFTVGICCNQHPAIAKQEGHSIVYIAAAPVNTCETVPPGMVRCELPAGRYAKFTHRGAIAELPHTVDYIWGTWLPKGEYEFRDAPDFEIYDERFDPETMQGEIDIYVPVK
ncbi:MAG: AraC family transcriptional regulator [Candidatus Obscuribacterales bacterium]|nr:AraC family transcriptional regulator [Candidatus Obscuribacterales bacterium]